MQHLSFTSFLCMFVQVVLSDNQRPDDNKISIIMEDQLSRDADRMDGLNGRATFMERKSLPDGDLFSNQYLDNLRCGNTYSVSRDGHYNFNLSPNKQPCDYKFLGSRNERCTVAVLCNDIISFAPPSSISGCDKEWLVLTDGTEGMMTGCGRFSFSGTPRVPRNNGTDLYFFLKGSSSTRCIAFCNEDLGKSHKGIKQAKKVSKNKQYQGFKMETQCKCGIRKDFGRVVGGETAFKNEFPWIGSVVFKGAGYERKPFCGGSLVSDRYFLSAAHCFAVKNINPHEIQVVLHAQVMDKRVKGNPFDQKYQRIPGWDLPDETDQSERSVRMDVQEIRNHPLFNDRTFDFDIAILKFTRAVNLKKGKLAPICLPYVNEFFPFEDDTTMVVAGWGRPWEDAPAGSRTLQKLDVPYMNLKDCADYTLPSKRHLCAGYTEGGKDACAGDSGGPLIYQFNRAENQYLLSGIVSAGAGCARKQNLGLYTDVQELLQWIYYQMPDAVFCPREELELNNIY